MILPEIGQTFYVRRLITEEIYSEFSELSRDKNPLHINDKYALTKGYEHKVCYGNILGLLLSELVGMHLWDEEVLLISEKIDFHLPFYIGDEILLMGEIISISDSIQVVKIQLNFSVNNKIIASGNCLVKWL